MGYQQPSADDRATQPRSALTFGGSTAATVGPPPVHIPERTQRGPRRMRWMAPSLAVAVAAVVIAVLVNGGGAGSAPATGPVVQAAYATTREPGFKFSMSVTTSAAGQSSEIGGEGSLNTRTPEGTMNRGSPARRSRRSSRAPSSM